MHDARGGGARNSLGAKHLWSVLCWSSIVSSSFVAIHACFYPTVPVHNGPFVSRHENRRVGVHQFLTKAVYPPALE